MKQISALILIAIIFASCQNQNFKMASGTMYVVAYIGVDTAPRGPFLARYSTRGIIDSNGKAIQDTSWQIRDAIDTVRDAAGKPVFDSTEKKWKRAEHWVALTETGNPPKNMVQVVPIPPNRMKFTLTPIKEDSINPVKK